MPMLNQPSNQIKLTNVSLVRYKKGKKRFELACYKNKLLEYRQGTETDLDNVLQVPTIFLNVSKGETAPNAELLKAWPQAAEAQQEPHVSKKGGKGGKKAKNKAPDEGDTEKNWKDAIIEEILKRGEIQVNEGERRELQERMEREVVEEVRQRLVDPQTKRVYTTGMIQKGLDLLSQQGGHKPAHDSLQHRLGKLNLGENNHRAGDDEIGSQEVSGQATPLSEADLSSDAKGKGKRSNMPVWRGVDTNKAVKVQALDAIRALIAWQPIPVMRARMRLRVTCRASKLKDPARSEAVKGNDAESSGGRGTIKDGLLSFFEQVESQDVSGDEWEATGFIEPGAFKGLTDFCSVELGVSGTVEVLDTAVVHQDD